MTKNAQLKPQYIRVVKDGKLWLRDRAGKMHGPFETLADAIRFQRQDNKSVEQIIRSDT